MWPFGRKDVAKSLRAIDERTEVEVVVNIAFVEPSHHVTARGYRSAPELVFVARDDLAPVFIEVST